MTTLRNDAKSFALSCVQLCARDLQGIDHLSFGKLSLSALFLIFPIPVSAKCGDYQAGHYPDYSPASPRGFEEPLKRHPRNEESENPPPPMLRFLFSSGLPERNSRGDTFGKVCRGFMSRKRDLQ